MKYLCLICAEKVMEQMTEADAAQHYEEYREFTDGIRKSGHLVSANRLKPPAEATTVRVRQGHVSTTDGPYAETKEQLGGILLLEAKDMKHAIELMSKHPGVRLGGPFEIRPADEEINALVAARQA